MTRAVLGPAAWPMTAVEEGVLPAAVGESVTRAPAPSCFYKAPSSFMLSMKSEYFLSMVVLPPSAAAATAGAGLCTEGASVPTDLESTAECAKQ